MRRLFAFVVTACTAISLLAVPAAPAGAGTSRYRVAVTDRAGDVANPRGDIVKARMRYGVDAVKFTAVLRNADSYKSANWQHGDTSMLFFLDANRSNDLEDYAVAIWNNRRDKLVATVFNSDDGEVLCRRKAEQRGDAFSARIPHPCLYSPVRLRFQLAMWYDRSVSNTSDSSVSLDTAPASSWTDWARRPPQPAHIKLSRPVRKAPYGTTVTLFGTFTSDTYNARRLSLFRRLKGTDRWTRVDSGYTSQYYGTISFDVVVRRSADYQLRFGGNELWQSSRSRVRTVRATMAIATNELPSTRALGSRVRATGRVTPANPGGLTYLQRRTSDGWKNVARTKLTQESTFSVGVTPKASDRYRYRVRTVGDGKRRAGVTPSFSVAVYDARIRKVEASDPASELQNLNSEYISVVNTGRVRLSLSDWWVGNVNIGATIPNEGAFSELRPGDGVRIHTGEGAVRIGHLYLYQDAPMWPPAGVARLRDARNFLVHERQYESATLQ